jgi:NTP pyrophosphatase (non-canonical NTP hydrolase)
MTYGIDELAFEIHSNAIDKGFWEANNGLIFYMKQIAMIHSEATEVLEAMRKEEGSDSVVKELADIIIRTLDLWAGLVRDGYTNKSIEESLVEKGKFNTQRERMHGGLA